MSGIRSAHRRKPLIALVERANRALQADMVRGPRRGHTQTR